MKNHRSLTRATFCAIVFLVAIQFALADDNFDRTCEKCGGRWNLNSHCCGRGGKQCCYSSIWFSTWYFWFGIGLLLMLLLTCSSYLYKKKKVKRRTRVGVAGRERIHCVSTTITSENSNACPQQREFATSDTPPTYQQFQQQSYPAPSYSLKNPYDPNSTVPSYAPPPYATYKS